MADAIPHAVLSEQLQERIGGRRLVAAIFLTYQFDPGFFEQEILPVLLDIPLCHLRTVRLLQLEDALRANVGRIAVYFDAGGLVVGDAGSAKLDVRRIPMHVKTGFVFHPKNIFLLLEAEKADKNGYRSRALLVAAMSANLTRSGWWENVEACHFEEIAEEENTRLKEDVRDLLRDLRRRAPEGLEHVAVEEMLGFLRETEQRQKRVSGDRLLPHFYSGREAFPDFLERVAGERIRGNYLEIISPFLDDTDDSKPLAELIARFQPKEVRILLPYARSGGAGGREAMCRKELYESIRRLPNVRWGRLRQWEKSRSDTERFIHAKVYRFFTQKPKQEICFVGSSNLTTAAHGGHNWESGLLVEADCPAMPDYWLVCEEQRPEQFRVTSEVETSGWDSTPLILRYSWPNGLAEAFWDAPNVSPPLRLVANLRGIELGGINPLQPKVWGRLADDIAGRLAEILKETSFVEVHGGSERPALLLIQEEGMSHKPSLLFTLTVRDILQYWSLLTPAQRSAFVEARAEKLLVSSEGSDLITRIKMTLEQQTFFDRFAGFFHSFACLEREVREQLLDQRENEATYRLFGRKYDSLGTLVDRVVNGEGIPDDVDRYVILSCANQLLRGLGRDFSEFWKVHAADVEALRFLVARMQEVRERLTAKDPTQMPAFLDWFDRWFVKRAAPLEVVS